MADNPMTGFELAVAEALHVLGTKMLNKPKWFVAALADLYDPDSPEVTVLDAHCGEEMLWSYAKAAKEGTADALGTAAGRAELWLRDVRRVNAGDAHVVAWGIARGVAAHLDVGLPRGYVEDEQPRVEENATVERAEREEERREEEEREHGEKESGLAEGEREGTEAAQRRQEELGRLLAESENRQKADKDARKEVERRAEEDSHRTREIFLRVAFFVAVGLVAAIVWIIIVVFPIICYGFVDASDVATAFCF